MSRGIKLNAKESAFLKFGGTCPYLQEMEKPLLQNKEVHMDIPHLTSSIIPAMLYLDAVIPEVVDIKIPDLQLADFESGREIAVSDISLLNQPDILDIEMGKVLPPKSQSAAATQKSEMSGILAEMKKNGLSISEIKSLPSGEHVLTVNELLKNSRENTRAFEFVRKLKN